MEMVKVFVCDEGIFEKVGSCGGRIGGFGN